MEIFEDLSFYCRPKSSGAMPAKSSANIVDELNTPVFEKAPFDYIRPSNVTDFLNVITSAEDPSQLSNIDNVIIENNLLQESLIEGASRDITSPLDSAGLPENYLSRDINSNTYNMFYQSNSEHEDIYYNTSDSVTPISSTALLNDEDEYLPTVGNCSEIYINNSNSADDIFARSESNGEYVILQTSQFETPENSRSASECSDVKSPMLKLEIGKLYEPQEIDTPQVIDAITSFENDKLIIEDQNFNIFNFITDEDIATSETVLEAKLVAEPIQFQQPSQIKTRRCKQEEDDDEDYEPPGCKRKKVTHALNEELLIPKSRRGRPPKRKESISSEDYTDSPGRYREMRNKNNEASRKSRLKRKIKEIELEEEATILQERNTKLTAQVQELEKTVINFRTNLMQLLLKK